MIHACKIDRDDSYNNGCHYKNYDHESVITQKNKKNIYYDYIIYYHIILIIIITMKIKPITAAAVNT